MKKSPFRAFYNHFDGVNYIRVAKALLLGWGGWSETHSPLARERVRRVAGCPVWVPSGHRFGCLRELRHLLDSTAQEVMTRPGRALPRGRVVPALPPTPLEFGRQTAFNADGIQPLSHPALGNSLIPQAASICGASGGGQRQDSAGFGAG